MIDYKEMTVRIGNSAGAIDHFETWWMTPFGLAQTLDEAKSKLESNSMPLEILRPITVAVCDNSLFEPII